MGSPRRVEGEMDMQIEAAATASPLSGERRGQRSIQHPKGPGNGGSFKNNLSRDASPKSGRNSCNSHPQSAVTTPPIPPVSCPGTVPEGMAFKCNDRMRTNSMGSEMSRGLRVGPNHGSSGCEVPPALRRQSASGRGGQDDGGGRLPFRSSRGMRGLSQSEVFRHGARQHHQLGGSREMYGGLPNNHPPVRRHERWGGHPSLDHDGPDRFNRHAIIEWFRQRSADVVLETNRGGQQDGQSSPNPPRRVRVYRVAHPAVMPAQGADFLFQLQQAVAVMSTPAGAKGSTDHLPFPQHHLLMTGSVPAGVMPERYLPPPIQPQHFYYPTPTPQQFYGYLPQPQPTPQLINAPPLPRPPPTMANGVPQGQSFAPDDQETS